MSILQQQPIFNLSVHLHGCAYYITVNGMPVIDNNEGDQITTTFPINMSWRSGKNTLGVHVWPTENQTEISNTAKLELTLKVKQNQSTEEHQLTKLTILGQMLKQGMLIYNDPKRLDSTLDFTESFTGDVTISSAKITQGTYMGDNAYLIEQEVDIPSNLPLWGFFDSDPIPDVDQMTDPQYEKFIQSMIVGYQRILDAILAGNAEQLVPFFQERSSEIDAAFYLPPGTTAKKLKSAFDDAIQQPNSYFLPIDSNTLMVSYLDHPNVVKLSRENGSAAIVQNFSGVGSQEFDILFRIKQGKWIITR